MADKEKDFDRAAFERDLERTQDAIGKNVDPILLRRVTDRLTASRWFHAYLKVHPQIQDLRFSITKPDDSKAARAQEIDRSVKRGAVQHFVNCGKAVPFRSP
jgi:hypothetical protein